MPNPSRLYFAYGSNLSFAQMASRCPSSLYHSFGVLHNYRWIISERGYANVVGDTQIERGESVYGILYTLSPDDEERLDIAESVPSVYEKRMLEIEILSKEDDRKPVDTSTVKALVYIDYQRTADGVCKEEYVARMNRGIRDAISKGMPQNYVTNVLRKWVREEEIPVDLADPFRPEE